MLPLIKYPPETHSVTRPSDPQSIMDWSKRFLQSYRDANLELGISPEYLENTGIANLKLDGFFPYEWARDAADPKAIGYISDPQEREKIISDMINYVKADLEQLPVMLGNAKKYMEAEDDDIPREIRENELFGYLRGNYRGFRKYEAEKLRKSIPYKYQSTVR